jgi:hypothetical protein
MPAAPADFHEFIPNQLPTATADRAKTAAVEILEFMENLAFPFLSIARPGETFFAKDLTTNRFR